MYILSERRKKSSKSVNATLSPFIDSTWFSSFESFPDMSYHIISCHVLVPSTENKGNKDNKKNKENKENKENVSNKCYMLRKIHWDPPPYSIQGLPILSFIVVYFKIYYYYCYY